MTEEETVHREALNALDQIEPATVDELSAALGPRLEQAGIAPAYKVDGVSVNRLLAAWARAEPPLVTNEFPPEDVDHLGRPFSHATRVWNLTETGEQELARLKRLDGGD